MTDVTAPCRMGDAGIAVCLLSLPFRDEKLFYDQEIPTIFANYRAGVQRNFGPTKGNAADAEFHHFYKPSAYFLFGQFDLAVISLVDDFDFTARTFRPFDPLLASGEKPYFENFLYKVNTGPTPSLEPQVDIVARAKETFLAEQRKPLFAMSALKLDNGLLLGSGMTFLTPVLRLLAQCAREAAACDLDVVVLQSHRWHEITLLMFASSYSAIVEFVQGVSEKTIEDLSAFLEPRALDACFFTQMSGVPVRSTARLFTDCETTLGFECSLLTDLAHPGWSRISGQDSAMTLFTRWTVEPGHLNDVARALQKVSGHMPDVTLGRGDLATMCPFTTPATTVSCLRDYVALRQAQVSPYVLQCYTVVSHKGIRPTGQQSVDATTEGDATTDPLLRIPSRKFQFGVEANGYIQSNLRRLGTPKIVTMRVLNMFSNFNDGLLDRNLYGYFLELLPFMKDFEARIAEAATMPGDEIALTEWTVELQRVVSNFEIAYRNRFYNSYRLGEVTDFNTNFKGGIQQLVTAFDGAYKAIAMAAGNHHSFAAVSGEPGIFSTSYETRLNYFHVFQPETFLTVAMHEAASNCFTGLPTMMSKEREASLAEISRDIAALTTRAAALWRDLDAAGMLSAPDARSGHPLGTYFLRSIVLDRLALRLSYNSDDRLFWFWYWAFVAQIPTAYDHPLALSERGVTEFLFRLCMVSGVKNEEEITARLGPFRKSSIGRICESAQAGVLAGLRRLREIEDLSAWLGRVDAFIKATIEEVFADVDPPPRQEGIQDFVKVQAAKVQQQIRRGEVVPFQPDGRFSPCRFCQILAYAYLDLLMKQFASDEDPLLPRDREGRTTPQGQTSPVLVDPLGGTFTHDAVTRRDYFRYRSSLTLSLWNMAMKMKSDMIREHTETPLQPAF